MSVEPHHESSKPPPLSSPHEGTHVDDGWRPRNDDDSARAVAYRARYGHNGVKSLRVEIAKLAESVGGLTGAVEAVKKLLIWTLRIIGALMVAGAAKLLWDWISTLHH